METGDGVLSPRTKSLMETPLKRQPITEGLCLRSLRSLRENPLRGFTSPQDVKCHAGVEIDHLDNDLRDRLKIDVGVDDIISIMYKQF